MNDKDINRRIALLDEAVARKCHWCGRKGSWPQICMNTRDMEDKPYDPICDEALLNVGGGERIVNQQRSYARHQRSR